VSRKIEESAMRDKSAIEVI